MWLSDRLQNRRAHALQDMALPTPAVPTAAEAELFAVETRYKGGYTPIGVHAPQHWLGGALLDELLRRCPAARDLTSFAEVRARASGGRW